MTTIIGVEHKWGCSIAADSQATFETRKLVSPDMNKLVRRGKYIIGAAGIGPMLESLMRFTPPKPSPRSKIDFMRRTFVPALREHMAVDNIYLNSTSETVVLLEGIIALNGRLYMLSDDGSITRSSNGVYGCGSGSPYGIGAAMVGASAGQAVRIAADLDIYTSTPVLLMRQFTP